ncbi:MAG: metal ABC transporter permease [Dehalococcoidia bacterium]|nr:metal ABC transporter permease [Dehalococcoidia bacterium]
MAEAIDLVRDPWSLEFMRRALLAAMVVSAVSAVIGSFVILKGMAFIGDALPHASFGGVAVAFVLDANLYLGGAIAAVLTAILIGFVSRRGLIKYDTAIGILFVGAFAAGILIISRQNNYTPDLFSFVFGNVLGVSWGDVWTTAALSTVILLLVLLFYKEILFVAYDPSMAAASGLPVAAIQYGLLALVGVTTVIGLQTVGIVLVVALLVTPAATAQLLTRRLPPMMAVGALVGVLSSLVGLYIAYYADVAASAAIVLTATGFFALAFLFAPGRGLLWQRRFAPAERA